MPTKPAQLRLINKNLISIQIITPFLFIMTVQLRLCLSIFRDE